jgi:hypothetical protein
LELLMTALESMFFALTGARADQPAVRDPFDEIGAVT